MNAVIDFWARLMLFPNNSGMGWKYKMDIKKIKKNLKNSHKCNMKLIIL